MTAGSGHGAWTVTRFFSAVQPLTNMIYTGVFARHPGLKIVIAEVNFGWVPFWRFMIDDIFTKQKSWAGFGTETLPSETIGKNVFVTVLDDQVAALAAAAQEVGLLDLSRVGIRGWSFGGYLAALAVLRRPDVFHAAVAGAPLLSR